MRKPKQGRSPKPKDEKMSGKVTVRMRGRERRAVERLRKQEGKAQGLGRPMSAGEYFFEGRRKEIELASME
jgi:hypothetical protein